MFGFKGSPMSRMSNQQQLSALGSALRGDDKGLQSILTQIGGQGGAGPVMNDEGQDISAAFGSAGAGPTGLLGQLMGGAPLGLPLQALGKRFGFGGK